MPPVRMETGGTKILSLRRRGTRGQVRRRRLRSCGRRLTLLIREQAASCSEVQRLQRQKSPVMGAKLPAKWLETAASADPAEVTIIWMPRLFRASAAR